MIMNKLTAVITALIMLGTGNGKTEDVYNAAGMDYAPKENISTEVKPDEPADTEEDDGILSPVELCEKITIGWNLGNTLDATGGSGLNTETSWGNPKATEKHILAVKDAGFDAVRIPTTWYKHMDDKYNIDKEWMARVKEVVNYAYNNDMYVILNTHHENWNYTFADNEASAKKILKTVWRQIAKEFKDYDQRLIFEGMNEPRKVGSNLEWNGGDKEAREIVNRLNEVFVDAVRATGGNNKTRCLMIPTNGASAGGLDGFTVPDDDYLIVSIHAYTPYNFAMNTGGGSTKNFSADNAASTNELKWLSAELNNRFVKNGIGVIIGECGATDKGNLDQRLNWARYFPDIFGQYGIPVFLWDNGAFGTGNEKYGLINRNSLTWAYPSYIKALVEAAQNA